MLTTRALNRVIGLLLRKRHGQGTDWNETGSRRQRIATTGRSCSHGLSWPVAVTGPAQAWRGFTDTKASMAPVTTRDVMMKGAIPGRYRRRGFALASRRSRLAGDP